MKFRKVHGFSSMMAKSDLQKCIAIAVDNIIFKACKTSLIVVAEIKLLKFRLPLRLFDFHTSVCLWEPILTKSFGG